MAGQQPVSFHRRAIGGLLFPLAALAAQPVLAGDWKLTDSLTVEATAVDRSGVNSRSGLVFQLSPRIGLSGRGARASADINYRLTTSIGSSDTNPRGLSHNLVATGEVEAIEDLLTIGAEAGAALVGNDATSGPIDAINVTSDGTQTYSLRVSPVLRHRFNRYVNFVSRNSVDYVTYSGNRAASDDSYSTTVNASLQSGTYFGAFNWSLNATQQTTEFDRRDDTRTHYSLGLGYRLNPRWAVNGSVGYEENDVLTTRTETDGETWDLGFDWTPNPRTSLSATYGQRYIGNVYSGRFTHRTKRTVLSLEASREVSNRRDARLVDAFFFLLDGDGNRILDPATGNPLIVNIPQLRETDEDFLSTQLRAAVSVNGRRTAVTVAATATNRQFEVTEGDEDSYALTARVSRQLGGKLRAALTGGIRHADSATDGESDTYDTQVSLSKSLTRRTSATVTYLYRDHDSSAGGSYTENRVGVALTTSFL